MKTRKKASPHVFEGKHDPTAPPHSSSGGVGLFPNLANSSLSEGEVFGTPKMRSTLDSEPPSQPLLSVEKQTFFDLPPGEGLSINELLSGQDEKRFANNVTKISSDGELSAVPGGLILLEQLTVAECSTPNRPMLKGVNKSAKVAVFFRPRCKMWSCPACAKVNSDLWCMRVVYATHQFISQGDELAFVTATSHERLSAKSSVEVLPHSWHMLSMRLRRAAKGAKYVLIPERHKSGRVHIHLITTARVGVRWWKDNARSCGMGYEAEEEAVYSPSGAGFYMGKYLAKQLSDARWKKGFRRIRTSLHFPKLPTLPRSANWDFSALANGQAVIDAVSELQGAGFSFALANHKSAWVIVNAYDALQENHATI